MADSMGEGVAEVEAARSGAAQSGAAQSGAGSGNAPAAASGNPFATVGHPVHGPAHVGRAEAVGILSERVLMQLTAGATAIIGPPRIGKTSLAYHVFMGEESRAHNPRLLPVWVSVPSLDGIRLLFRRLADKVWELLGEQAEEPGHRLAEAYARAVEPGIAWAQAQTETQEFLKLVRRRGWRVVLILDEFDAARDVFKSQSGAFKTLREMAYDVDSNVGLVTTSRRELREIVDMADADESTFPGIFRSVFLTCFDHADLAALAARAPQFAQSPHAGRLVARLAELTGGHPYLASVLLDRIWTAHHADGLPEPEQIALLTGAMPPEFQYYYRDLEELLRRDGRLRAVLEVILGPQLTVTRGDAQYLLQQGLIRVHEDAYRAFSDHFQQYLTLLSRESGQWDSWMAAEAAVRDVIESAFEDRYGADWLEQLRRIRPGLVPMLDRCEELRERELRTFGDRASTRLLDFTYPRDLYDLMVSHWDLFGSILGKDKRYWDERFSLLAKVRNPMVHNRMSVVTLMQQRMFQLYCAELLDILGTPRGADT